MTNFVLPPRAKVRFFIVGHIRQPAFMNPERTRVIVYLKPVEYCRDNPHHGRRSACGVCREEPQATNGSVKK
jgi:hypothetical protein